MNSQEGRLCGPFRGYGDQQVRFTFARGGTWRQNERKYLYHYLYNPRTRVIAQEGRYFLEVRELNERVEVVRDL
ncbi:MAG: hypothetical protein EOO39_45770 [Cytophagaceae bacterium]|nr:MAG: hypothetical protein EOO39_45770 [Cytophagaceae bacterium]